VAGYRNERIRQEMLFEAETNGYKGEEEIWLQNNTMITFKTWLKSNKRSETCTESIKSTMNQSENISQIKESKMNFSDNEVDQIFNQMTGDFTTDRPVNNVVPMGIVTTDTTEEDTQSEECHCDCDMCCRNDHIACDNDNDPCCQEQTNAET
jgi:hypothetical protein